MPSDLTKDLLQIIIDKDAPPDLQVDDESNNAAWEPNTTSIAGYGLLNSSSEGSLSRNKGSYMLADPTDPTERARLDLQHLLFRATLSDELFAAPVKELEGGLRNVLDVATGTGIWAADFASQFPAVNVIGTDLSLPKPKIHPSNCHFEAKDAEGTWDFPHRFDYIHGRALAFCFASHLNVIKSAFNSLCPGGYLELQDCIVPFCSIDETFKGTLIEKWTDNMMKGSAAFGTDWTRVAKYKQYLEEAGFEDVVEERYEWPIGTWAKGKRMKVLGELYREDLLLALDSLSMAVMTRGLGMDVEEVKQLVEGVKGEIRSNRIHVYASVRFVYGRKPR